ncbi:transglycosylase family protein [Nocardia colli]|uniref:transglycosylase family protein n=1 Tax=Nocardia colli TaxID=2545717 RepID=UPI0035D95E0B
MTGRHRKRPATGGHVAKLAIAGTIFGSGVAWAGNAAAAPQQDWDSLAQCEAGGNWAADTGNGYYGGLQMAPGTWAAYRGDEFADTAAQATREQQIRVGERVLAAQSWGAWPSCAKTLGLHSDASTEDATQAAEPDDTRAAIEAIVPPLQLAEPDLAQLVQDALTAAKALGIDVDPAIARLQR